MSADTSVDTATADRQYRARRAARYEAQRLLWKVTDVRKLAYCGRVVTDRDAGVTVRVTGTPGEPGARAGFSGLQTCGSVWACPVCSEKINAVRQQQLEAALVTWIGLGNSVVFGTFTMRHNRAQSLAQLWAAISPSWSKVVAGPQYVGGKKQGLGDRDRFAIAGWCRLVEVKYGDHGWHPHIHALFFVRGELDDDQLEDMRRRFFGRWQGALGREGYTAVEFDTNPRSATYGQPVGVDLRRVRDADFVADYFAKNGYRPKNTTAIQGAAYEVTGSQSKKAGKGGRTPFQILADLVDRDGPVDRATGELLDGWDEHRRDLALWHEWEKSSGGKRQLTWSRGLRDLLGQDEPELTDEEAAEQADLQGDAVCLIGVYHVLTTLGVAVDLTTECRRSRGAPRTF